MILASNNQGKLKEIKTILDNYDLKTLNDVGIKIDIEEDQDSFYGNALKKATGIYTLIGEEVIADDSGLCIDVLNGWPGVMVHRFLDGTDRERNLAILDKLKDISYERRTATVVCYLVYYNGEIELTGQGILKGYISFEPKGLNGFGFDEIFMLEDGRTLAELSSEEKNRISARYLAINDLKAKLEVCI